MRLAVILALASMAVAACKQRPSIRHSCAVTGASADHSAIVYAQKRDGVLEVVRLRGGEKTVVRGACLTGLPDTIFVEADGERALLYGSRGNIDFDLFGHAGRHVSLACAVDFATRTASPEVPLESMLEAKKQALAIRRGASGALYAWRPDGAWTGVEVIGADGTRRRLSLPRDGEDCEVTDDGETRTIACFDRAHKTLAIDRSANGAPASTRVVTLVPFGMFWGSALSGDGTRLAYWGRDGHGADIANHLGVIDLASGEHVLRWSGTFNGAIATVAFDPTSRELWVGDWTASRSAGHDGRLRRIDELGRVLSIREIDESPDRLYAGRRGRLWVDTGCELREERL